MVLKKSESWAQDNPLSKKDGLSLLDKLIKRLSKKEKEQRGKQLEQARHYIEHSEGGLDAVKKKTFRNRKTKDTRVDIEILAGTAFVSIALLLIIAYFCY